MRFAIISDVHANLPACQTVLADIMAHAVDSIICLGDTVGYGPLPAETLNVLHERVDHFVMGNHDAALCGLLAMDAFSDDAAAMINWTRERVDAQALAFLKKQPLTLRSDHFLCVHGTAFEPETFGYIYDEAETRLCLSSTDCDLVFVGHTHCPGIQYLNKDGDYRAVEPTDFIIEPGKRYVVNPGSVGMPRDGDFRSSYCIIDTSDMAVTFHRVAFDIEQLRAVAAEGHAESAQLGYVLTCFDECARGPVREGVNFSPVTQNNHEFIEESRIGQRRARVWQLVSAFLLAVVLAVTLGAWSYISRRMASQPNALELTVPANSGDALRVDPRALNGVSLICRGLDTAANNPLENLTFHLENKMEQTVQQVDMDQLIIENSRSGRTVEISSPKLYVSRAGKAQVYLLMHSPDDIAPLPTLFVDYIKDDGTVLRNAVSKPAVAVRGNTGEYRIQKTTPAFPTSVKAIKLRLQWMGGGRLRIHTFTIHPK